MKAFETFVDGFSYDGFKMSFKNGFTISVQFSKHHRCDAGKSMADVAIWDAEDNWYLYDEGTWHNMSQYAEVMSYQTAEQVANLIQQISIK